MVTKPTLLNRFSAAGLILSPLVVAMVLYQSVASTWAVIALLLLWAASAVWVCQHLIRPMQGLLGMIDKDWTSDSFFRWVDHGHGRGHGHGIFSRLSMAMGQTLERLEKTTKRLTQQKKAFSDLYQQMPAALLSINCDGIIIAANVHAATLLGVTLTSDLVGQHWMDPLGAQDNLPLQKAIQKLQIYPTSQCQLQIKVAPQNKILDIHASCAAISTGDLSQAAVRITLTDISQTVDLQRQLDQQNQLVDLVAHHMSDAILLVDWQGRIAAHNAQLCLMVQRLPQSLAGAKYHVQNFWDALELVDRDAFVKQMRDIESQSLGSEKLVIHTRQGIYQFEGIAVHDPKTQRVSRLWVVADITSQQQNKQLLNEQADQLQVVKQISYELACIWQIDDLLTHIAQRLPSLLKVKAVGVVLRDPCSKTRGIQIYNQGLDRYDLAKGNALAQAAQCKLMPSLLGRNELTYWPKPPEDELWSDAFAQVGLTRLAGLPLSSHDDQHGILWVGEDEQKPLSRHQMYLLEALSPVISARIAYIRLHEQHNVQGLGDPVTNLANAERFQKQMMHLVSHPNKRPWSAVLLQLESWAQILDKLGPKQADRVLLDISHILKRYCRSSNVIARLPGPGFGILCQDMAGEDAMHLGARLLEKICQMYFELADHEVLQIAACVGIASYPTDGHDATQIMGKAKQRVKLAQATGHNKVVGHQTTHQAQSLAPHPTHIAG